MKILRIRGLTVLALFFLGCALMGSTVAWAAPMLWSYPDDHILISEVQYQGAPGSGEGTEWIELYNPTSEDLTDVIIHVYGDRFYANLITPTPLANGTFPYLPIKSQCYFYIAYDAGRFYDEFEKCPQFAYSGTGNCPQTQRIYAWDNNEIADSDESLCLSISGYGIVDSVGWGTGGEGRRCSPVENPLSGGAEPGETLLRGADLPEWIGPGGEGAEVVGTPQSEQLDEVWRLSGDVQVPWEDPEVGMCRTPTAISLKQTPQATTAQSFGEFIAVLGLLGLTACIILAWRRETI